MSAFVQLQGGNIMFNVCELSAKSPGVLIFFFGGASFRPEKTCFRLRYFI